MNKAKDILKNEKTRKIILTLLAAVIMLASFQSVKPMTSVETHSATIAALDEKKTTVMELAAASTAASAAITLIPGDTATPIADKLADLSSCFLIVLCAIYLEKYLVTMTGYASFMLLIPAACILFTIFIWLKPGLAKQIFAQWSFKLAVLALAVSMVIPASMFVSARIEDTYAESINITIENAKEATEIIEDAAEEENKGISFITGLKNTVTTAVDSLEQAVGRFMEAFAVMMVTSCIIPVVVLFFFVWLLKLIVGINIPMPSRITAFAPAKNYPPMDAVQ